jgi:Flp pilus assembly protein TadD
MNFNIEQSFKEGVTAINEGKFGKAKDLYQAILRIVPTHSDAHNNLGICLQKMNKLNEAVTSFKQAILL